MLSKNQKQQLERAMQRELESRPSVVYKCAAGIVFIVALSIAGPMIGFQSESMPQIVAGLLDRFAGISN